MAFLLLSGGSGVATTPASAPVASSTPPAPSYMVAMTAYNAVPGQTDSNPFETASGAYSNPEVVAARSQDLGEELPFGTIIEIDGPTSKQNNCGFGIVSPILGYRVIADTMNVRYTKRVDVLFDVCHGVTVRVVGHIDPKKMGNLPKTQTALAAIVNGAVTSTLALNK